MRAVNETQQTILGNDIIKAETFLDRLSGLIPYDYLPFGAGLFFAKGGAIHTFGMRFPIDIVFLKNNCEVIDRFVNVKPNHIILPRGFRNAVLELPTGVIQSSFTAIGDRIRLES